MGDILNIINITWGAIALVIASVPGIALIAYLFQCGYQLSPFRFYEYFKLKKEADNAMEEGISMTANIFIPNRPINNIYVKSLALIFAIILVIVNRDTTPLIFFYLLSVPLSIISYKIGKRYGDIASKGGKILFILEMEGDKTFHRPRCEILRKKNYRNIFTFFSRDQAINEGYKPCNNCKP